MENIKDPILQIKDVCISYTSDVMAVKHVSADIEKNTITAIMGPSGCGTSGEISGKPPPNKSGVDALKRNSGRYLKGPVPRR